MIVQANSLSIPLADKTVQCVVTSPPYWGLRDYGVAGQLGLEETPGEYCANMVAVFREVWRVLRDNGTLWLNLGDCYASAWACNRRSTIGSGPATAEQRMKRIPRGSGRWGGGNNSAPGLKEKDLVGIPWRVAFALQDDGWYLRSDIIWSKPNCMPESVTDRPTKAHEYLFLLAKNERYYYDADAIREEAVNEGEIITCGPNSRADVDRVPKQNLKQDLIGKRQYTGFNERWSEHPVTGRNKRTVWSVPTAPYSGAHFATYPPALVEPCIKAGSRPGDIVFDPFNGSGTTGLVAQQLGRRYVGLDLNWEYLQLSKERLGLKAWEEWQSGIQTNNDGYHDLPLFVGAA